MDTPILKSHGYNKGKKNTNLRMPAPPDPTYNPADGVISNLDQLHADSQNIRQALASSDTNIDDVRQELETLEARIKRKALKKAPVTAGVEALRMNAQSKSAHTDCLVTALEGKVNSLYSAMFSGRRDPKSIVKQLPDGEGLPFSLILNLPLAKEPAMEYTVAQALVDTTVELGASVDATLTLTITLSPGGATLNPAAAVEAVAEQHAALAFPSLPSDTWKPLVASVTRDGDVVTAVLGGLNIEQFTILKESQWVSNAAKFVQDISDGKWTLLKPNEPLPQVVASTSSPTSVPNQPAAIHAIAKWFRAVCVDQGYDNPWAEKPVVTFNMPTDKAQITTGEHVFTVSMTLPYDIEGILRSRFGDMTGFGLRGMGTVSLADRHIFENALAFKDIYDMEAASNTLF